MNGVSLPLYLSSDYVEQKVPYSLDNIVEKINVGFGDVEIYHEDNLIIKDKIVEYAVKEMSIEEIEKKLGYKIKIVNKEE